MVSFGEELCKEAALEPVTPRVSGKGIPSGGNSVHVGGE